MNRTISITLLSVGLLAAPAAAEGKAAKKKCCASTTLVVRAPTAPSMALAPMAPSVALAPMAHAAALAPMAPTVAIAPVQALMPVPALAPIARVAPACDPKHKKKKAASDGVTVAPTAPCPPCPPSPPCPPCPPTPPSTVEGADTPAPPSAPTAKRTLVRELVQRLQTSPKSPVHAAPGSGPALEPGAGLRVVGKSDARHVQPALAVTAAPTVCPTVSTGGNRRGRAQECEAMAAARASEDAQRDVEDVQREIEEAQRDVEEAQREIEEAQREAEESQRDIEEALREAYEAQREAQEEMKHEAHEAALTAAEAMREATECALEAKRDLLEHLDDKTIRDGLLSQEGALQEAIAAAGAFDPEQIASLLAQTNEALANSGQFDPQEIASLLAQARVPRRARSAAHGEGEGDRSLEKRVAELERIAGASRGEGSEDEDRSSMSLEERVAELERLLKKDDSGAALRAFGKSKAAKEKSKKADKPGWKAFTWDGENFQGPWGKGEMTWKDGEPKLRLEVPGGHGRKPTVMHIDSGVPHVLEIPKLREKIRERIQTPKAWSGEHRQELERLMREMQSEVEGMRSEMLKLREELEALPESGAR